MLCVIMSNPSLGIATLVVPSNALPTVAVALRVIARVVRVLVKVSWQVPSLGCL